MNKHPHLLNTSFCWKFLTGLTRYAVVSSALVAAFTLISLRPAWGTGYQTCKVTGMFDNNPFLPSFLGLSQNKNYQFKYGIPGTADCNSFTSHNNSFFTELTQFEILGVDFSSASTKVSPVPDTNFVLNSSGDQLMATLNDINLISGWGNYDTLDELTLTLEIGNSSSRPLTKVSFDLLLSGDTDPPLLMSFGLDDLNPNTPESVGSIPEPSLIFGLLSLGAFGLTHVRNKP